MTVCPAVIVNAVVEPSPVIPTDLEDYIPVDGITADEDKKYVYSDLTASTVTASIWYAFDSIGSIGPTSATVQNQNPT